MKKNLFSDNKQGSKGFYAALGISAVMIGSACWFAYGQSRKMTDSLTAKNSISEPEAPVNKRAYNVPKATTETPAAAAKLSDVKPPLDDISFMITPFSGSELVRNETTGSWQTHNGTDFAADVGAEVYAVASGEVTEVKNDPVWGVTVTVDHMNGFVTRYCGLSQALSVQKGDKLSGGDLIGTLGNTADIESSLTPHLHLEMLHNGAYIDPMSELT